MKNLQKYLEQVNKQETKNWINSVLNNYLDKNEENQGEIEHILDYLESDKAPSRLLKMSYLQAKNNAEKWIKSLNKKAINIVENESDIEIIKSYKNGYKIVKLIGKNSYEKEGLLMKHCVATYFDKKDQVIYSLRDENNLPHCTFSVVKNNNTIQQVKGKGNGSINPKYIQFVLDFFKEINYNIRSSELENLGYYQINDDEKEFLEKNTINASFLENNGKNYVFLLGKTIKCK